jgi:hypothetical protein
LHYYSRLRFTQNLLPLLNKATEEKPTPAGDGPIARVFSVLGGGLEGNLNTSDLSLKNNFTLSACATHAITMTTLSFNKLSTSNPKVTFIHTQPGGVETNITREFNRVAKIGLNAVMFLLKPWTMTAAESGERHAWDATTNKFGNGGVLLVGSKGDIAGAPKVVEQYEKDGTMEKVWDHTTKVFKDICEGAEGKYEGN